MAASGVGRSQAWNWATESRAGDDLHFVVCQRAESSCPGPSLLVVVVVVVVVDLILCC